MVRLVSILASALDTRGAEYASRRDAMLARLAELDAEHAKALASIPKVPPPATDPVFGPKGPLLALWRP